jgi:hypothetical protein
VAKQARSGAGGWYYPPLLTATVILLSHLSGYVIPANRSATLELALLTTPYGMIRSFLFDANPQWMFVYSHEAARPGFFQNGSLTLMYCVQLIIAWRWLKS